MMKRTARRMYIYAIIGVLQSTQLTLLSSLYRKAGYIQLYEVTLAVQNADLRLPYDRLLDIEKMPSEKNHLVYCQVHKLLPDERVPFSERFL